MPPSPLSALMGVVPGLSDLADNVDGKATRRNGLSRELYKIFWEIRRIPLLGQFTRWRLS